MENRPCLSWRAHSGGQAGVNAFNVGLPSVGSTPRSVLGLPGDTSTLPPSLSTKLANHWGSRVVPSGAEP